MPESLDDVLNAPATTSPSGLTVGMSPQQRLELAMRRANNNPGSGVVGPEVGGRFTRDQYAVPNPFGSGLDAWEPNNVLFDAYKAAFTDNQDQLAEESAIGTPMVSGNGLVAQMVDAALGLAARNVPYVWGGTSANGVDCSGLIVYAARAAGITLNGQQWPRLRAVDYRNMGQAVSLNEARAGDIVYYDTPGTDTDHVGIYLGNGQVVQAPNSGDHVRISNVGNATSIRRIFDDNMFSQVSLSPDPSGAVGTTYNGQPYNPAPQTSTIPSIVPLVAPTFGAVGPSGRYYAPAPERTYRGTR